MPVQYTVRADVIDIRTDKPRPTDAFLVDTNVWLWVSYAQAGGHPNQRRTYPAYIRAARAAKATLRRCELSLAELAHQIEKIEREIFERTNGMPSGNMKPKEYRHNYPNERASVANAVDTSWKIVKSFAAPMPMQIDEAAGDRALAAFGSQPLDGYDLFMVQAATAAGILQVLTDDGDFCTVPDIQMFTANANVIAAARTQRKLAVR